MENIEGVMMSDNTIRITKYLPSHTTHKDLSDLMDIPYSRYNFMLQQQPQLFNVTISKKLEEANDVYEMKTYVPNEDKGVQLNFGYVTTITKI